MKISICMKRIKILYISCRIHNWNLNSLHGCFWNSWALLNNLFFHTNSYVFLHLMISCCNSVTKISDLSGRILRKEPNAFFYSYPSPRPIPPSQSLGKVLEWYILCEQKMKSFYCVRRKMYVVRLREWALILVPPGRSGFSNMPEKFHDPVKWPKSFHDPVKWPKFFHDPVMKFQLSSSSKKCVCP